MEWNIVINFELRFRVNWITNEGKILYMRVSNHMRWEHINGFGMMEWNVLMNLN